MDNRKVRLQRTPSTTAVIAALCTGAVLCVGAALWVPRSFATVMVEVPMEQLAWEADGVVIGRVRQSATRMLMGAEGVTPYTFTQIVVDRWVGEPGGSEIQIAEIGGASVGGRLRIDGIPEYQVGQEVLVFLERHPTIAGVYRTFAMSQGKFEILRGAPGVEDHVIRDLEHMSFARWQAGQMGVSSTNLPNRFPMAPLLNMVEQVRAGVSPALDSTQGTTTAAPRRVR